MSEIATARINSFGQLPGADAQPEDPILEIPLSDLECLLKALVETHNQIAAVVQEAGILRGRELARVTESHSQALRAEKSPIMKVHLLNIFIRRHIAKIREALKARPTAEGGKVVQVVSKIAARAIQIIDYIKTIAQDPPRKEIALDSQQARILFAGAGGEPVSRKETIRAMRRAEKLWPALLCGHRPGDPRQTMRISARAEDIAYAPEVDCFTWQRSSQRVGLSL